MRVMEFNSTPASYRNRLANNLWPHAGVTKWRAEGGPGRPAGCGEPGRSASLAQVALQEDLGRVA